MSPWPDRIPLAAALALGAATACAPHAATMRDVRDALVHGDLAAARDRLADAGRGTDDLLFALEDGTVLHYAGEYDLSNQRFAFAEARVDELYTKSITRAALSLISSDVVLHFEPRGVEPFMVHYYRAFNYLRLGEPEEAAVEWRKLAYQLQFAGDRGDAPYLEPPFLDQLVGLALESDDPNTAYVALRRAEAVYRRVDEPAPPDLVDDLMRLAYRMGSADQLEEYRRRYGAQSPPDASDGNVGEAESGEIVVLVEDGFVAPLREVRAYLPIATDQADDLRAGDAARTRVARALAAEYAAGHYDRVTRRWARRPRIAYVLPVALPTFGAGLPAFSRMAVRVDEEDQPAAAWPVLQVSELQRAAFESRLTGIYVKTILRALVKYALAEEAASKAKKEGGEGAEDAVRILANVANIVTERADTRAWLALPDRLWMARLRVEPGEHHLVARLDDAEPMDLGIISVGPGERRFVTARAF